MKTSLHNSVWISAPGNEAPALAKAFSVSDGQPLLGVDSDPALCEASHPTLSSIQIDHELAGYVAARLLAAPSLQQTDGDNGIAEVAIGPLLALRRESTGGYGRREPFVLEAVETIRRAALPSIRSATRAGTISPFHTSISGGL